MSDLHGTSRRLGSDELRGDKKSLMRGSHVRDGAKPRLPAMTLKGNLPPPLGVVESRISSWVPRPLRKLVPSYRVDEHGMTATMPGRGITSLRWLDVLPSLEFSKEIRTEYEGYRSAQKLLVLHTRQHAAPARCRIELPKLREPIWIGVHENSWEIGRAALLQLLHHASGPVSISTGVFLDLEINPDSWERARYPKLLFHLYMLATVAAGLPLTLWVHQATRSTGWTVGAFVGYAIAICVLASILGACLLPAYFGPGIAFGNDEDLLRTSPHPDKAS